MLGAGAVKPTDTAEERAKNIFNRYILLHFFISKFSLYREKYID